MLEAKLLKINLKISLHKWLSAILTTCILRQIFSCHTTGLPLQQP